MIFFASEMEVMMGSGWSGFHNITLLLRIRFCRGFDALLALPSHHDSNVLVSWSDERPEVPGQHYASRRDRVSESFLAGDL
jgi:hypothetical protein